MSLPNMHRDWQSGTYFHCKQITWSYLERDLGGLALTGDLDASFCERGEHELRWSLPRDPTGDFSTE